MTILLSIVYFVIMFAVLAATIFLARKFIFPKVKINKYIPLAISIICLAMGIILNHINMYLNIVVTLIAIIFFVWFMDINSEAKVKNQKQIKIRPKAKPNRVKNKHKYDVKDK